MAPSPHRSPLGVVSPARPDCVCRGCLGGAPRHTPGCRTLRTSPPPTCPPGGRESRSGWGVFGWCERNRTNDGAVLDHRSNPGQVLTLGRGRSSRAVGDVGSRGLQHQYGEDSDNDPDSDRAPDSKEHKNLHGQDFKGLLRVAATIGCVARAAGRVENLLALSAAAGAANPTTGVRATGEKPASRHSNRPPRCLHTPPLSPLVFR